MDESELELPSNSMVMMSLPMIGMKSEKRRKKSRRNKMLPGQESGGILFLPDLLSEDNENLCLLPHYPLLTSNIQAADSGSTSGANGSPEEKPCVL